MLTLSQFRVQVEHGRRKRRGRRRVWVHQISTTDRTHARTPDPTHNELKHTITRKTATHERNPDTPHVHTHTHTKPSRHTPSAPPTRERTRQGNHRLRDLHRPLRQRLRPLPPLKISQSVSQLFHGPAPRSPLHRLAVRLRHSRSNTSGRVLAPGGDSIVASEVNLSQP